MSTKLIKTPSTIFVELTEYGAINVVHAPLRLHKDSYNVTRLACAVPVSLHSTNAPLCKVFATCIDSSGQSITSSRAYNLPLEEQELTKSDGFSYRVFSAPLPIEFCATSGELKLTFNYFDTDGSGNATTVLSSGTYATTVSGEGVNLSGVELVEQDETAAKVNQNSYRLNAEVVQVAEDSNTLPSYMLPFSCDGYKRLAVEYQAQYSVPTASGVLTQATGKVRVIDFVRAGDKVIQTEVFSCGCGVFLRKLTFNYSASGDYSNAGNYAVPNWSPISNDYWQNQINEVSAVNAQQDSSISALKLVTSDHETRIVGNSNSITALEEKENKRDHFKGLFQSSATLPKYDELDPKGATDNDFAHVVSSGTIWQVNEQSHAWEDTLAPYPSDTTLIETVTAPQMNGIASAGTASKASASDHIHPHDITRAAQADLNATNERVTANESNIASINTKQVEQGEDISALDSRLTASDIEIESIKEVDSLQDGRITANTADVADLRVDIAEINTQNTAQNARLDGLDTKTSATDSSLSTLTDVVNGILADFIKKSENTGYSIHGISFALNGDQLQATVLSKSLATNETKQDVITVIASADETHTGLMKYSYVNQLGSFEARISALEISGSIYFVDLSGLPSNLPISDSSVQSYLTGVFDTIVGKPSGTVPEYGVLLKSIDPESKIMFEYSVVQHLWFESFSTASLATNDVGSSQGSAGVSVGTDRKGGIRYDNGRPFMNGYDDLVTEDTRNSNAITAEVTRAKAAEVANVKAIELEKTTRNSAVSDLNLRVNANSTSLQDKANKATTVAGKPLSSDVVLDTLSVQRNGVAMTEYNGNGDKTVDILVPTRTSDITNNGEGGSKFATVSQIPSDYISTSGGQTIAGTLSLADPTEPQNAATKAYVDNNLSDLTQAITPVSQSAETIHLSGTSAGLVDKLVMTSQPRQVISPNLLNCNAITQTLNGITFTVNANKSITINGTATADTTYSYMPGTPTVLKADTRVYVNCFNNDQTVTGQKKYLECFFRYNDGTTITRTGLNPSSPLVLAKETASVASYFFTSAGNTFNNYIIYPMLTTDVPATMYQPYTGQPSPDNSIPINVVSSPVEIMSVGQNIFNYTLPPFTHSSGTYTYNNGIYTFDSGTSNGAIYWVFPNSLVKNKTVTMSLNCFPNLTSNNFYFLAREFNFKETVQQIRINSPGRIILSFLYTGNLDIILMVYRSAHLGYSETMTFNDFQVNYGDVALPYTPYKTELTTSLPLITAPTQSKPSEAVELLGEYNTESNILTQKWKKVILDGSSDENWRLYGYANGFIGFSINYTAPKLNIGMCDKLRNYNPDVFYKTGEAIWFNLSALYLSISKTRLNTQDVAGFRQWLATNPLTVYYELATPEVLTMTPLTLEQTPKTLDGETNIFATNNASQITFDVTELLVGEQRADAVLKDKGGSYLMPYTAANQVEVDKVTGTTLDRELEAIEASIAGIDIALATETTARTQADIALTTSLDAVANDLVNETNNRTNADTVLTERINTVTNDLINEMGERMHGDDLIRTELADGSLVAKNAETATNAVNQPTTDDSTNIANTAFVNDFMGMRLVHKGTGSLYIDSSYKYYIIKLPKSNDSSPSTNGITIKHYGGATNIPASSTMISMYHSSHPDEESILAWTLPNGTIGEVKAGHLSDISITSTPNAAYLVYKIL